MAKPKTNRQPTTDDIIRISPPNKPKKKWFLKDLNKVEPLTKNQDTMCRSWKSRNHICAIGYAGTGKTFMALGLALETLLTKGSCHRQIKIIRSTVQGREVGFLPGNVEEKIDIFQNPYRDICAQHLNSKTAYDDLVESEQIEFLSSSFIRGSTWDNSIVIVDEVQNMTWKEIDGIATRLGENSNIIFCGDHRAQCDLNLKKEKSGVEQLMTMIPHLPNFCMIEFTADDIVRSPFVKSWIITREKLFKE